MVYRIVPIYILPTFVLFHRIKSPHFDELKGGCFCSYREMRPVVSLVLVLLGIIVEVSKLVAIPLIHLAPIVHNDTLP